MYISHLVTMLDAYRGGDSYSKLGGLMRGEAQQRAIAHCDLGVWGHAPPGFVWVCGYLISILKK